MAGINGYTITSCKFYTEDGTARDGYTVEGKSPSVYLSSQNVYTDDSKSVNIGQRGISKIEVYGTASSGTPFAITWSAATPNTASIDKMPAGNVTVNVDYFPKAELAAGGAPAAIANVPATTDEPIVSAGTVKNIGQSEVPQGRQMYYASQTEMTDDDLLALAADKWSPDVPTATDLAQGSAYVYYYIQGAEPATIAERTDANTCSDGDILAANVVPVTLAAEPTYTVSLNKTGLDEGEPALWKAKSDNQSEVVLGTTDLEGVKKGETVTVTYTGQRKVIGVKAEKKAPAATLQAVNITGDTSATLYFLPGETFGQAIANHPENTSFRISGEKIYCNDYRLFIGDYSSEVTPNTPVEANGDYRGLIV